MLKKFALALTLVSALPLAAAPSLRDKLRSVSDIAWASAFNTAAITGAAFQRISADLRLQLQPIQRENFLEQLRGLVTNQEAGEHALLYFLTRYDVLTFLARTPPDLSGSNEAHAELLLRNLVGFLQSQIVETPRARPFSFLQQPHMLRPGSQAELQRLCKDYVGSCFDLGV